MTPNARYAAAIEILDRILSGTPAEKTLTTWARSNRYAGSKDRAAVRDIVFDCLRCKRSFQYAVGFDGPRGLVAGHILAAGQAVDAVFTGERFAPQRLTEVEQSSLAQAKAPPTDAQRHDIPDWIEPKLRLSLGDDFESCLTALQSRAPLDLRVNVKKSTVDQAQSALAEAGIETIRVAGALRVTCNPRRVALCKPYQNGLVEIQDAGSQAVVANLPLNGVSSVLDYCAGGGGKTLAMAALAGDAVRFEAYDRNQARMKDFPNRLKRAGVQARILKNDPVDLGKTYDLVLLDVPCSGTGSWRRNPDAKWRFTHADLQELQTVQAEILMRAQALVSANGLLAYVTCSLLFDENEAQVEAFVKTCPNWVIVQVKRFLPNAGTDGFFLTVLKKQQL